MRLIIATGRHLILEGQFRALGLFGFGGVMSSAGESGDISHAFARGESGLDLPTLVFRV